MQTRSLDKWHRGLPPLPEPSKDGSVSCPVLSRSPQPVCRDSSLLHAGKERKRSCLQCLVSGNKVQISRRSRIKPCE